MDSILELEEYARTILQIPYVNFDGLNFFVGKAILETIEEVFFRYPFLRHMLSSIGNRKYITDYLNLNWYADFETWKCLDSRTLACDSLLLENAFATLVESGGYDENTESFLFCALSIGDFIWSSSLEDVNLRIQDNRDCRNLHSYCDSIKPLIYHEMGHLLDCAFLLSDKECFTSYYEKNYCLLKEQLSYTASLNTRDFFAEVFSYYHCGDHQNPLVENTMELIFSWTNHFHVSKKELECLNLTRKYKY